MNEQRKKTILLVEDEVIIAMFEKKTLERYGYKVIHVNSGEKAIQTVDENHDIDIILMDIDLGMGIDATEAAEKIFEKHDIPLIFLSSHTERKVVEKTEGITSYGYIVKDSGETVLIASIKMAFLLFDARKKEKEKEKIIRESDERYQSFISQSSEGIYRTEFDVPIDITLPVETQIDLIYENAYMAECNDALAKMYKMDSAKELLGLKLIDAHGGKDNPLNRAAFRKLIENNYKSINDETFEYDITGKPIWFLSNTVGTIENGHLVRLWGTTIDITDRKLIENELRLNNEKYSTILKTMSEGIALNENIYNEKGEMIDYRILEVNDAFYSVADFKGMDVTGNLASNIYGMSHEQIKTFWQTHSYKNEVQHTEMISPLGKKWFYISTSPFINDKFVTSFFDITDRKQSEALLQESEEKFRNAFQYSPIGMAFVSTEGKWLKVNSTICKIVGYSEEELLKKTFQDITHPDDLDNSLKFVQQMLAGEIETYTMEKRYFHKQGNIVWVHLAVSLVKDNAGNPLYFVSQIEDITQRKQVEEKLNRTQKLESLGILAGGIAHDFNNLLSGIFGYIDLAEGICENNKVSEYLEKALSTIDRTRGLTQQLITFAKGGVLNRKPGNLFPYIHEVALFALSGSNVSCTFDIPEEIWSSSFDQTQIGQVIENIVINSCQAMPRGGSIFISGSNVTLHENAPDLKHGNYIKILIKDNGSGIPKEIIPKIFDPFFTTKEKGKGLGLSSSYSIIKQHDGIIEVESEQGKGTTFTIYLPALRSLRDDISEEKSFVKHTDTGRILVMDDEQVVREIISDMLRIFGYSVLAVKDGKEALEILKMEIDSGYTLSAIILDLTIPGGFGGKEIISEIKKLDKNVPVFVSSGYSDDNVMKNPVEYGFTDSISKPFGISQLAELFEKHLKKTEKVFK